NSNTTPLGAGHKLADHLDRLGPLESLIPGDGQKKIAFCDLDHVEIGLFTPAFDRFALPSYPALFGPDLIRPGPRQL
ncbi:hypothetical protein LCGC14_2886470, partial [marine sediment metagenome]